MKLKVIAGNCVLEDIRTSVLTYDFLKEMSQSYDFELIYKSSWRKDNRSTPEGYVGPELSECKAIFTELKNKGATLLTDYHTPNDTKLFTDLIDVAQVPAYLCMQTSLLESVARMGKSVNIKKGQFLHPEDLLGSVQKIKKVSEADVSVTERGTCFGYRDLVVDMRSFQVLKNYGTTYFDAGHSVRKYGISSNNSLGGEKKYINVLSKSAIAAGADGLFVEVHPNPLSAMCDAATQLSFAEFVKLITQVSDVWRRLNED